MRIVLPNVENAHDSRRQRDRDFRMYKFGACLYHLKCYEKDIEVVADNGELSRAIPPMPKDIRPHRWWSSDNYFGFFMAQNKLFLTTDKDDITFRWKDNLKHFHDIGVAGIFVLHRRTSTEFIFENCSIPVFCTSLPLEEPVIPTAFADRLAHSKSLSCDHDISIFFHGRYYPRIARQYVSGVIKKEFPDSVIRCTNGITTVAGQEYLDLMCRSKIVWCPRSQKSFPDYECNGITAREIEAMCLEKLVVRNPIGLIETEPRINKKHYVEVRNDNTDLVEILRYYLEHDDERKEIARQGRLWYERNCSPIARAYYIYGIIKKILES